MRNTLGFLSLRELVTEPLETIGPYGLHLANSVIRKIRCVSRNSLRIDFIEFHPLAHDPNSSVLTSRCISGPHGVISPYLAIASIGAHIIGRLFKLDVNDVST